MRQSVSLATNIVRRGATYYLRITVPVDLQKCLSKIQVWRSLRTKDPAVARSRAPSLSTTVRDEWNQVRRQLSDEGLRDVASGFYRRELSLDEAKRNARPTAPQLDAERVALSDPENLKYLENVADADLPLAMIGHSVDYMVRQDAARIDSERRAAFLADLRNDIISGETKHVAEMANFIIRAQRLPIKEGTPAYQRICQAIKRAWVEALERASERDAGRWDGESKDPIVTAEAITAVGETVMEAFETYARENPRCVTTDTLNQSRMAMKVFVDLFGAKTSVSLIDKKAVREWKALLIQYPVKASEIAVFKNLSLREIVEANKTVGKPTISIRTLNRYLSSLGAFCDWLVAHDYLSASPVNDMHVRQDRTKLRTQTYSPAQLKTLFKSPLFTGCISDDKWHLKGNVRIKDHRYWLPLLMLLTGARPAELAQLMVEDVKELHGTWIIHITTEGDGDKSVKTKGSMRVVPVHSELIKLGWIDYCREMRRQGQQRLFPYAERNSRGQIAASFSREYGRFLSRIGIKAGRGLSLYSFRHGFVDALRRAEFLDEQFGYLVGHARPTMTGQYGQMPQGMLRPTIAMIEAVKYEGLDLSHLYAVAAPN